MTTDKKAHAKNANQRHQHPERGGTGQDQRRGTGTGNANSPRTDRQQTPGRHDSEAGIDMPGAQRPPSDS